MAQAVPGTHEQRLQGFLTTMQWDEEDLTRLGRLLPPLPSWLTI
jgi:hypothetical protein